MNKEQLIKEYDEKAKALRDEFISKLEDDKKEFKLTYPEDGSTVYFTHRGDKEIINGYFWVNSTLDKNMFETGNYFETKEEAEQHLKECELLFKLHQWAKIKNNGWQPDWENEDEEKYYIELDCYEGELDPNCTWAFNKFSKLPYFKSKEITQECIDLFRDEIIEVLV